MLNMGFLSSLVDALLDLSPVCLQNVPPSTSPCSKAEACSLGSGSPGALTGSAHTDMACSEQGLHLSLLQCTIQETRALQMKNKMK